MTRLKKNMKNKPLTAFKQLLLAGREFNIYCTTKRDIPNLTYAILLARQFLGSSVSWAYTFKPNKPNFQIHVKIGPQNSSLPPAEIT